MSTGRRRGWRTRLAGRDRGVTLVELIVSMAILVVLLPLAGLLLESTLLSQRDTGDLTRAGDAAQTVAGSVEAGVRNASAFRVTYVRPTPSSDPDELLVVRTRGTGATWRCEAWWYDAAADTVWTRRVPESAGAAAALTPPSSGIPAGWTALARGVTPRARPVPSGSPTPTPAAGLTGPAVLTATSRGVELGFTVATGRGKPVVLSTAISKRPQGQTGSAPCF
ncbi:prepilin-type N-terminal cleavage/methylation domain-containing protein [Cellulomonas endophytica]|uniref:prepilin-type N-terminal cleavage/methylation domain-containing protein n=1 Tax=Cellulomonas endophytica TaxID=2494735 RepID=UPI0013E94D50|nr:prepilin-type N-terminal cleavage/methylation domain-containing protein [Cellulomonas endophytica]